METSSGRNFFHQDWNGGKPPSPIFAQSLELSKVLVDLTRKDLRMN